MVELVFPVVVRQNPVFGTGDYGIFSVDDYDLLGVSFPAGYQQGTCYVAG